MYGASLYPGPTHAECHAAVACLVQELALLDIALQHYSELAMYILVLEAGALAA
jgi:hypothetical protein